ncbi:hypothetical protein GYMLUDRAFT_759333 [Collybiopsis luxurians FD-317 M1]|uniref:Protein CPL1-like domain-containing protein n=1 Tax=Collybiopsis luxurians FD-317 M1 TaxID=944289 RepID=A0A0D0B2Q2_9AGAR|nr:hypothetical protein GYMLUDRAFT_759333 [Collybiopsis luxurians FD-317 M1]
MASAVTSLTAAAAIHLLSLVLSRSAQPSNSRLRMPRRFAGINASVVSLLRVAPSVLLSGGCLYAHPWAQSNPQTTLTTVRGQDCTTLQSPQALGHRCEIGRCIIDTCTKGYIPTKDGSACVPSSRIVPRTLSATGLAGPHTPGPASVPRRGLTPARSGSDIVVTVPGVANADLNLGDGLNNLKVALKMKKIVVVITVKVKLQVHPLLPSLLPLLGPDPLALLRLRPLDMDMSLLPLLPMDPGPLPLLRPVLAQARTRRRVLVRQRLPVFPPLLRLLIHPGNLVEGKRSQPADGCDGEDGNGSASGSNSGNGNGSYGSGSTPTHPPPPPPSPSPSSGADEPCPDDGTVSGDPSANSGDIVVSVPGITNTDLNLGPGLNNLVNGLSGDLGLGSLIHPGHLVEGRSEDEEDCGCEDGQGSATGTSTPTSSPSSSGSGYQPSSSSPGYGSQPSSSSSGAGTGTGSCSSQSSGTSSSSSSGSGSDIVITVPGIANADLNLGDGLNNLVDGLAGGLGLGSLIHPGHLVESKRSQPADGCDGEDGSGSASGSNSGNGNGSYGSGSTPTHPPSPPPSPSPSSGADEPCPDDGTTSDDPPASSGDIVVTVPGITNTDLNLGPGLNNLVNGLSGDLGLGSLIHPGRLVEGRSEDEEDCGCEDGQGSATGTPTPTSSPSSSGSGYQPPSSPGYGSQPSSSPGAGASTCPSKPSSSGAQSSTGNNFSEKDIVLSVPGLTNSDLNLGPGLNNLVTGLAGELGLGSLAHPGQLVGGRS